MERNRIVEHERRSCCGSRAVQSHSAGVLFVGQLIGLLIQTGHCCLEGVVATGNVSATVCFIEDLEDLIVEVEGARTEFGPGAGEGDVSLDVLDLAVFDGGIVRAPAAELVADSVLVFYGITGVESIINFIVAALVRRGIVGSRRSQMGLVKVVRVEAIPRIGDGDSRGIALDEEGKIDNRSGPCLINRIVVQDDCSEVFSRGVGRMCCTGGGIVVVNVAVLVRQSDRADVFAFRVLAYNACVGVVLQRISSAFLMVSYTVSAVHVDFRQIGGACNVVDRQLAFRLGDIVVGCLEVCARRIGDGIGNCRAGVND